MHLHRSELKSKCAAMAAGAFLSPRVVMVLIVWSTRAQVDTFERWLGMVTYLRPVNVIIFIASDVPQCVNKYWNKGIPNLVSIIQIFVRSITCCVCVTEIFLVCVPWVVKD